MLQAMRGQAASWVVKIILGLLIIAFAAWGINDVFLNQTVSTTVAEVDEREIEVQELQFRFRTEMQRLQPVFGNQLTEEQAVSIGLLDSALNRIVDETVLTQEASNKSIAISDEAVRRQIQNDPAFQDATGNFDRFQFQQILRQIGFNEPGYIAYMRQNLARALVTDSAAAGVRPPGAMTEQFVQRREERRRAETLIVTSDAVSAPAEPTQGELEAYYADNTSSFQAPEYRAVTFIDLSIDAFAAGIALQDGDVEAEYERTKDRLSPPSRRNVINIVLGDQEEAETVAAAIRSGETPQAAAEAAGTEASSLGWQTRGEMLPALADAAFSLSAGEVSDPVDSPLGTHVLVIEEAEDQVIPSLSEVRDQIQLALARSLAVDRLIEAANALDDDLAGGLTLAEAAAKQNLELGSVDAIERSGLNQAGSVVLERPSSNRFLETVFQTPDGETSLLVETEESGYYVVTIDRVIPPAPRPLDAVISAVTAAILSERQATALADRAQEIAETLRSGVEISTLVESNDGLSSFAPDAVTRNETNVENGLSQSVVSQLFDAAISDVVVDAVGETARIARLTEVLPPTAEEAGAAETALNAELERALQIDVIDQLQTALRGRANVDVNQSIIDRYFRQNAAFGAQ
ncbi:MAG: SurA N-terminal domain-containing protein [Pseudomonadota bacterium]